MREKLKDVGVGLAVLAISIGPFVVLTLGVVLAPVYVGVAFALAFSVCGVCVIAADIGSDVRRARRGQW